jgi:A/G-specific adenine glycosylase
MDLGATVCTPKAPGCGRCPFASSCAALAHGDVERFPRKKEKARGRLRRGAAFVALRADGQVLVRRRAPNGLLGGMTEVPTTEWSPAFDPARMIDQAPAFASSAEPLHRARERVRKGASAGSLRPTGEMKPFTAAWRRIPGVVTHVFTHFPLELIVLRADLPQSTAAPDGMRWIRRDDLAGAALPTVMRKVLAHALAE